LPESDIVVGISDINIYIPRPSIAVDTVVQERVKASPRLERYLRRAIAVTGQERIRFPELWEDTATMAAQASYGLIESNPSLDLSAIRYIAVGTETSIDLSKPIAAYVEGMLQLAGLAIPRSLSTYQVQHACAGGTLALLTTSSLLAVGKAARHTGLVICSDIAKYDACSSAEVTQGAGAVALLVERNPRLIELDLSTLGYDSSDVDDFFHPLTIPTARVKGQYSIRCYRDALDKAFLDYCRQRGEEPAEVLRNTDMFALHVPFRNMPILALKGLVERYLGLDGEALERFLAERGFEATVRATAKVGNIYAGSLFLGLAFLLDERCRTLGDEMIGKRILLASYGSGNTMVIVSGRIAPSAPEVISRWNLNRLWETEMPVTFERYRRWHETELSAAEARSLLGAEVDPPPQTFYLARIREDDYREYGFHEQGRTREPEGSTPRDLYGSR